MTPRKAERPEPSEHDSGDLADEERQIGLGLLFSAAWISRWGRSGQDCGRNRAVGETVMSAAMIPLAVLGRRASADA